MRFDGRHVLNCTSDVVLGNVYDQCKSDMP